MLMISYLEPFLNFWDFALRIWKQIGTYMYKIPAISQLNILRILWLYAAETTTTFVCCGEAINYIFINLIYLEIYALEIAKFDKKKDSLQGNALQISNFGNISNLSWKDYLDLVSPDSRTSNFFFVISDLNKTSGSWTDFIFSKFWFTLQQKLQRSFNDLKVIPLKKWHPRRRYIVF